MTQIKVDFLDHMGDDNTVVDKFSHVRIREAYARGYKVVDGELHGPKGRLSIKLSGKQRYPTFSTNWGGRVYGLPVHKLAAYQYYGEESFKEGIVVRHLDANTLNISRDNILLGSHSENNLDKCPKLRSKVASVARKAQGSTPKNAKLTTEQVQEIRSFYEGLGGKKAPNGFCKDLCNRFGVSKTVISKVVRGVYYPNV